MITTNRASLSAPLPALPKALEHIVIGLKIYSVERQADYTNPAAPAEFKNFISARAAAQAAAQEPDPAEEKLRVEFEAKLTADREAAYAAFKAAESAKV